LNFQYENYITSGTDTFDPHLRENGRLNHAGSPVAQPHCSSEAVEGYGRKQLLARLPIAGIDIWTPRFILLGQVAVA